MILQEFKEVGTKKQFDKIMSTGSQRIGSNGTITAIMLLSVLTSFPEWFFQEIRDLLSLEISKVRYYHFLFLSAKYFLGITVPCSLLLFSF